ncbi:hypothetical protein [Haloplanus salinus]|uniref:hypothetical protein n=1 Tax=Haloplanus salinus TaxID=1126245 RepID=UPI001C69B697|nr:hypothetical protein [Haloplanus salinus]
MPRRPRPRRPPRATLERLVSRPPRRVRDCALDVDDDADGERETEARLVVVG